MKKLFYLLFALPLLLISCDDDNKLPDIQMNVEISGATKSDGVLYIVQGETTGQTQAYGLRGWEDLK
ncbi:hypothetical protein [uncultured Muribaculum sp.]|uniref:hypothetical protein n=1 Tax=uncultured Muribaculum sp. TaxID=1918613 RepID=UPI0026756EE3|nr:hypothetical protein [uncultured Muribaculum sp.]